MFTGTLQFPPAAAMVSLSLAFLVAISSAQHIQNTRRYQLTALTKDFWDSDHEDPQIHDEDYGVKTMGPVMVLVIVMEAIVMAMGPGVKKMMRV